MSHSLLRSHAPLAPSLPALSTIPDVGWQQLREMDERQLCDLGLSRAEIGSAAFWRALPPAATDGPAGPAAAAWCWSLLAGACVGWQGLMWMALVAPQA